MNNLNEYIDQFFFTAASVLEQENRFLQEHFSACEREQGFYKNWHHGIPPLFETTMVYLVFRELLKTRFPLEIEWEGPYPHSKTMKADLIIKESRIPRVYIEFKIWKDQKAKDVKSDIAKLKTLPENFRGFIFVIWYEKGDGSGPLNWLQEELSLQLNKTSHKHSFPVLYYPGNKKLEEWNVILALLEIKKANP